MAPNTLRARDRLRPVAAPAAGPAPTPDAPRASQSVGWRAMQALCRRNGAALQEQLRADLALAPERMDPLVAGLRHNGYVRRESRAEGAFLILTPDGRAWAQAAGLAIAAEQAAPAHPSSEAPQRNPAGTSTPETSPPDLAAAARHNAGRPPRTAAYRTDAAGFVTHINGRPLF